MAVIPRAMGEPLRSAAGIDDEAAWARAMRMRSTAGRRWRPRRDRPARLQRAAVADAVAIAAGRELRRRCALAQPFDRRCAAGRGVVRRSARRARASSSGNLISTTCAAASNGSSAGYAAAPAGRLSPDDDSVRLFLRRVRRASVPMGQWRTAGGLDRRRPAGQPSILPPAQAGTCEAATARAPTPNDDPPAPPRPCRLEAVRIRNEDIAAGLRDFKTATVKPTMAVVGVRRRSLRAGRPSTRSAGHVTPGIIDDHSHPTRAGAAAHQDGNEMTSPARRRRAEHTVSAGSSSSHHHAQFGLVSRRQGDAAHRAGLASR